MDGGLCPGARGLEHQAGSDILAERLQAIPACGWMVYTVGSVYHCVWRRLHRVPQGLSTLSFPVLVGGGWHRTWLLQWGLAHVSVDLWIFLTPRKSEYVGVT